MVYQKTVTVPTAGVPQPLSTTRAPAVWVMIMADPDNTGAAYVVGVNPTTHNAGTIAGGGIELVSGGVLTLPPASDTNFYDLAKIFVDVAVSNEGFSVLYATR
jgi:hypothetical protein